MRIYLAGLRYDVIRKYHKIFPNRKLNVLISYGMKRNDIVKITNFRENLGSLILDSGTWTLNSKNGQKNKSLCLSSYQDYLQRFGKEFDFYFNFDEDFSSSGSWINYSNQKILEKAGLFPVPVVHDIFGTEIERYVNENHRVIALGSSQIKNRVTLASVIRKFINFPGKVHLFGNTEFDMISNFPLYSCDSSTWAQMGGYGNLLYWNPKKWGEDKTDIIYLQEYIRQDKKRKHEYSSYKFKADLDQYLKALDISYSDMIGLRGWFFKQLANVHYYQEYERAITEIHRKKGFIT